MNYKKGTILKTYLFKSMCWSFVIFLCVLAKYLIIHKTDLELDGHFSQLNLKHMHTNGHNVTNLMTFS